MWMFFSIKKGKAEEGGFWEWGRKERKVLA